MVPVMDLLSLEPK